MKLVDDTLELELSIANGYHVREWDLGFPAVREDAEDRVQADGTDDRTAFFGSRGVTLELELVHDSTPWIDLLDDLRQFCAPDRRPFLYYEIAGTERRIRLRADNQSAPIRRPQSLRVQAAWKAPDGVQEAAEETVETIAASIEEEVGIEFPIEFPFEFPASEPTGTELVVNPGKLPTPPVFRLYGPCTNPRIENVTTGEVLEFTANGGIELLAGEYLEVDVLERTVLLNGETAQSRYNRQDFAVSSWWRLARGDNLLRYYPVTFSPGALAEVRFRARWL